MSVQKVQNKQEFEKYKIDLLKIKNKYLVETIEAKKRLLADKSKMIERNLKLHGPNR